MPPGQILKRWKIRLLRTWADRLHAARGGKAGLWPLVMLLPGAYCSGGVLEGCGFQHVQDVHNLLSEGGGNLALV